MRRMGGGLKPQLDNNIQVIPARDIGSGFCIGWQGLARLIEPSLLNWSAIFRRCLADTIKKLRATVRSGRSRFYNERCGGNRRIRHDPHYKDKS
jgi:hypothetical protein